MAITTIMDNHARSCRWWPIREIVPSKNASTSSITVLRWSRAATNTNHNTNSNSSYLSIKRGRPATKTYLSTSIAVRHSYRIRDRLLLPHLLDLECPWYSWEEQLSQQRVRIGTILQELKCNLKLWLRLLDLALLLTLRIRLHHHNKIFSNRLRFKKLYKIIGEEGISPRLPRVVVRLKRQWWADLTTTF